MKKYLISLRSAAIRMLLGLNDKNYKEEENNIQNSISNEVTVSYSASPVLLNRSQYRNSLDKINRKKDA